MTNRKRIACFFTGGYTELNAMRGFLRKINPQADYIQLCPTGKRRSKKDIMGRHIDVMDPEQNGLTGKALLDHMLSFLDSNRFREEGYDAILIEDDRDDRFLSLRSDGSSRIDRAAWEKFQQDVRSQVERYAPGIPVLFILAAPEVESWFIADWEHGFGQVFRSFFSRSAPPVLSFFPGQTSPLCERNHPHILLSGPDRGIWLFRQRLPQAERPTPGCSGGRGAI